MTGIFRDCVVNSEFINRRRDWQSGLLGGRLGMPALVRRTQECLVVGINESIRRIYELSEPVVTSPPCGTCTTGSMERTADWEACAWYLRV